MDNFITINTPTINTSGNKFDLVISVLDSSLSLLFLEVFKKTRYFELGLDFYDICYSEILNNKDRIEDWKFESYQEELIGIRLIMLDYLNNWDEYISFTNAILQEIKIENRLNFNIHKVDHRYIYKKSNGKLAIHFLCRYQSRYEIIQRKIDRRNSGKNIEYLKRHQQDRLSFEQIELRYKTVVDFFKSYYNF